MISTATNVVTGELLDLGQRHGLNRMQRIRGYLVFLICILYICVHDCMDREIYLFAIYFYIYLLFSI